MQNAEVARMFDEYADILEIQAANPFRIRAYRNAARTLGDLAESLAAGRFGVAARLRQGEDCSQIVWLKRPDLK